MAGWKELGRTNEATLRAMLPWLQSEDLFTKWFEEQSDERMIRGYALQEFLCDKNVDGLDVLRGENGWELFVGVWEGKKAMAKAPLWIQRHLDLHTSKEAFGKMGTEWIGSFPAPLGSIWNKKDVFFYPISMGEIRYRLGLTQEYQDDKIIRIAFEVEKNED